MTDIEDVVDDDMKQSKKMEVISCSRRTDVPSFYLPEYLEYFEKEFIVVSNPLSGIKYKVSLSPTHVKAICWWSKNYRNLINAYKTDPTIFNKYPVHIFNFTLNSESILEPHVLPMNDRLLQVKELINLFGVDSLVMRYDPITFYEKDGKVYNNLAKFKTIISYLSDCGVKFVVVAFYIRYKDAEKRMIKHGIKPVNIELDEKKEIIGKLNEYAKSKGIELRSCCSNNLGLPVSSCISFKQIEVVGKLKDPLFKLKSHKKDVGQRDDCNCVQSRDIGDYSSKCGHSCLYCYANPKEN
jgi:hypothetical protein